MTKGNTPITATYDIKASMREILRASPDMAVPVVVIKALVNFTKTSKAKTFSEYTKSLNELIGEITNPTPKGPRGSSGEGDDSSVSHQAGTDLFLDFIGKIQLHDDFATSFPTMIVEKSSFLLSKCDEFREEAANQGVPFIKDGCSILLHSYSRLVLLLLKKAKKTKKHFKVYVTACSSSSRTHSGLRTVEELRSLDIPAALISDAAIGYIMQKVDVVLVGAEGVVRNGGIINQIGTFPIAVMAKVCKKPFYCVVESYKFVNVFPLDQKDLRFSEQTKEYFSNSDFTSANSAIIPSNPNVDYTPPEYISLLFTNEGILIPPAVAELILRGFIFK